MSGAAAIDVSILVNTFSKPRHLALVLESIALQRAPGCRFEVVVADDGSTDETPDVVGRFAARVGFPVRFTTQPHDGCRRARTRNAAARLAAGDYLLFVDGDCVLPPGHVAAHVAHRRPGVTLVGFYARLPEETSRMLVPGRLVDVDLAALVPAAEARALRRRVLRDRWYSLIRHPRKPPLASNDFSVWRADFERVNGFDERFVGWGQEDDDLGLRLRAAGVRLRSILGRTASLHVWHPPAAEAVGRWRDGPNVPRLLRRGRLTACREGLRTRPAHALTWRLPPDLPATPLGRAAAARLAGATLVGAGSPCEIDLVIRPGAGTFARRAQCRLVLAEPGAFVEPSLLRRADRVERLSPANQEALDAVLADVG